MINIKHLSGDIYITIDYDKNIPINYDEMKKIFNTYIIYHLYYVLIKNYEYIYTNLYDIFEIKLKKDILLDDMTIIFLPYDKKDVEYIKRTNLYININNIKFPYEELKNDKLFILMAVNSYPHYYNIISNELKSDKQIIINTLFGNKFCNNFKIFNNNNIIIKNNIKFINNNLLNDYEIAKIAIEHDFEGIINILSNKFIDNYEFTKLLLNKNPTYFRYISKRLQNKKDIIMYCIDKLQHFDYNKKYKNSILELINDIHKNDKDIVLPLVSIYGQDIIFASDKLKNDKDVVYSAIKNDPTYYKYINTCFFNDKEFILSCLVDCKYSIGYDSDNYNNFLSIIPEKFRDDKEIVIASLLKCCSNFKYCSNRLKNTKDIVLTAINNSYYKINYNLQSAEAIIFNLETSYLNIKSILDNTNLNNDPDILNLVIDKIKIYSYYL